MSGTRVVHTPAEPLRAVYLACIKRRRVAREWQRHAGLVPDVELLPTFADWRRACALALVGAATDPGRAR